MGEAPEGQCPKSGDKKRAAAAEGRAAADLDQRRDCGTWEEEANLKSMKPIKAAGLGNLLDWVVIKMGVLA